MCFQMDVVPKPLFKIPKKKLLSKNWKCFQPRFRSQFYVIRTICLRPLHSALLSVKLIFINTQLKSSECVQYLKTEANRMTIANSVAKIRINFT